MNWLTAILRTLRAVLKLNLKKPRPGTVGTLPELCATPGLLMLLRPPTATWKTLLNVSAMTVRQLFEICSAGELTISFSRVETYLVMSTIIGNGGP